MEEPGPKFRREGWTPHTPASQAGAGWGGCSLHGRQPPTAAELGERLLLQAQASPCPHPPCQPQAPTQGHPLPRGLCPPAGDLSWGHSRATVPFCLWACQVLSPSLADTEIVSPVTCPPVTWPRPQCQLAQRHGGPARIRPLFSQGGAGGERIRQNLFFCERPGPRVSGSCSVGT